MTTVLGVVEAEHSGLRRPQRLEKIGHAPLVHAHRRGLYPIEMDSLALGLAGEYRSTSLVWITREGGVSSPMGSTREMGLSRGGPDWCILVRSEWITANDERARRHSDSEVLRNGRVSPSSTKLGKGLGYRS